MLAEIVHLTGEWQLAGFTDADPKMQGMTIANTTILGTDEILPDLLAQGVENAVIGLGSIRTNEERSYLFEMIIQMGFKPATLIHPAAVVSPGAQIGKGSVIMAGAVVNVDAQVGENVIVNTGAIIEHDCRVEDHSHIACGACLSGGVQVGRKSLVGAGATVIQSIRIGRGCLIGAGAVVVRDIPDEAVALGVPARILGASKEQTWKIS